VAVAPTTYVGPVSINTARRLSDRPTKSGRDRPEPALKPYDILAVHPDDFLLDQLDLYPGLTINVLEHHRFTAAIRRHIR
jgi:hypothetical protein